MNWNTNTEKFYALDTVTFDDTSANHNVTLAGTLLPASVTVNGTANYAFGGAGKISGTTGLTDNDTGTLTIQTTNDYTGDTIINAGTVLVNGGLGVTTVTVNSPATLGGNGTILGPVTIQPGASFSPGTSIGTMAISNNLVLASGSTSVFEANLDTGAYDKVTGLRTVSYDGTLSLVLSGRPVTATDTFKLFSATTVANAFSSPYGGAFVSITPAAPGGAGLAWNTATLATDGTLRVVNTNPTNLTAQVSGDQLTLSWPADHIGWRLQRQITTVDLGFVNNPNNWVNVAGSTTTSSVSVTIDPTIGAAFYRLVYPSP
jgi:autotransporter-associated beta strand protein